MVCNVGLRTNIKEWLKHTFLHIFSPFHTKRCTKVEEKKTKSENGQKSILTSFQVGAAPESWWKCTSTCYARNVLFIYTECYIFNYKDHSNS